MHIALDNDVAHKTQAVKRRLEMYRECHVQLAPTSVSWPNQVERVCADITQKRLGPGVLRSVADVEKAATGYIHTRNDNVAPFARTADASTVLGRVAKHRAAVSMSGHRRPAGAEQERCV